MKFETKILKDRISFDDDVDDDAEYHYTTTDEFLALETVVHTAIETINSDDSLFEKYDVWYDYVDETAWVKTRHLFESDVAFSMAYNYIFDMIDEKLSNPLYV